MRSWGRLLVLGCAAGWLAACTAVVDSVVESRYGQYNQSTDWAKNEAILLNIVRASKFQPLNFMSFQPYTGSATVTAAASAPSFIIGPDRVASQKQYTIGSSTLSAGATGVGTIGVTMLDTQGFYAALLTPVQFTDLYAFQRQGYPRELLFRLFTDYVSLKPNGDTQGRDAYIIYNNPVDKDPCFPLPARLVAKLYGPDPTDYQRAICFKDLVQFALLSGMSSEIRTVAGPPAAKQSGGNADAAANANTTPAQSSAPPATTTEGRICFDGALANRAIRQAVNNRLPTPPLSALRTAAYHPICGATTGADKWPDPPKAAGAAPLPAKPTPAAVKAAQDDATAKAQAADAAKTAGTADAAAKATTAASAQTTASKLAAAAKSGSPAKPAPTANPSAGVNTLTVVMKTNKPTGFPIWDMHLYGQDTVEIGTRSTFAIYNFLGQLLGRPEIAPNIMTGSQDVDDDPRILTVNQGQPVGCFAAATLDLQVYCVPIDGADNTKRTFSILAQLLALKTTTGDLQLTPTLRLLPE